MNILWLDDVRNPVDHGFILVTWVKTAEEAIEELKTGNYDFASLDHDLAWEHYPWNDTGEPYKQKTGYDVVLWLEENPQYWPKQGVRIHSMNPVGRVKMQVVVDRHYNKGN